MGLIILALLFSIGNDDFFVKAAEQKAAGYKWYELAECRQVKQGLPAITVDTVVGERVCYKLGLKKEDIQ